MRHLTVAMKMDIHLEFDIWPQSFFAKVRQGQDVPMKITEKA